METQTKMIKRLFDVVAASIVLLLPAPVFLAAALMIALETRGPIFTKVRRIGCGGRSFRLITFRILPIDSDVGIASERLTRAGRWLRRVRLDGLPQLINVLIGDLSLVGPRPEAPQYVRLEQPIWRQVLSVRPGIFGPSQLAFVFDRAEPLCDQAAPDWDYMMRVLPVKLHLDRRYVLDRSLLLDLKLLAQTVLLLISQRQRMSAG
jgi:lipopolysaccharide/colanic/teichoic acid biosynthesis glycosyltransferase